MGSGWQHAYEGARLKVERVADEGRALVLDAAAADALSSGPSHVAVVLASCAISGAPYRAMRVASGKRSNLNS